jgi:hypothetical protein
VLERTEAKTLQERDHGEMDSNAALLGVANNTVISMEEEASKHTETHNVLFRAFTGEKGYFPSWARWATPTR